MGHLPNIAEGIIFIDTLASDYNDCDSDTVEWAHNEIRKLQERETEQHEKIYF